MIGEEEKGIQSDIEGFSIFLQKDIRARILERSYLEEGFL